MADFRRNRISRPIRKWAKRALPQLSETEAEALGAGEVWWEAETGHDPDSGLEAGVISRAERAQLTEMDDLVARVIAVDDFTPEQLRRLYPGASASHENVAKLEETAT